MHTWLGTQTEGWWRYAFDNAGVPYAYINTQTATAEKDLRGEVRRDRVCADRAGVLGGHSERYSEVCECAALAEDEADAEPGAAGFDGGTRGRG